MCTSYQEMFQNGTRLQKLIPNGDRNGFSGQSQNHFCPKGLGIKSISWAKIGRKKSKSWPTQKPYHRIGIMKEKMGLV